MSSKKTTTTETGVALIGQYTLENVPSLLQQVNEKIKELKGDRERAAKVTEPLGAFGKISDIKDAARLRDAYAFITRKAAADKEFSPVFQAIDPLTKLKEFTEAGHGLKVWQDEILAQYREVTFESKLAKLTEAKRLLEENLSGEQKFQQSMKNIMDIFA